MDARDEMAWIACRMVGDVLPRQRQCADETPCEACYERGDAILSALASAGLSVGPSEMLSALKDCEAAFQAWVEAAEGSEALTNDELARMTTAVWTNTKVVIAKATPPLEQRAEEEEGEG